MERTYVGPLPRGVVTFPDDSTVAFTRGVPVEITPDQAKALSEDPDWGGTEPADDLGALSRDDLLKVAEDEGIEINKRWGEQRIADTIRSARQGDNPEGD